MKKQTTRVPAPIVPPFEWTRSETLALAQQNCTFCFGLGLRPGRAGSTCPCNCVFRSIFRACYERFRDSIARDGAVTRVSFDPPTGGGHGAWSMKHEEYAADFCLVAARTLTKDSHRIFRFHYLLGADWRLCCRKLGMERGEFFHECYRIEQALGRTFRELLPYPLFPVDEYFHCSVRRRERYVALPPVAEEDAWEVDAPPVGRPSKFPLALRSCA